MPAGVGTEELRAGLQEARRGTLGLVLLSIFPLWGGLIDAPVVLVGLWCTVRLIRGMRRMALTAERSRDASFVLLEVALIAYWLTDSVELFTRVEGMRGSWWGGLSSLAKGIATVAGTGALAALCDWAGLGRAAAAWQRVRKWALLIWLAPAVLLLVVASAVRLFTGRLSLDLSGGPPGVVVLALAIAASVLFLAPFFGLFHAAKVTEQELQRHPEPAA